MTKTMKAAVVHEFKQPLVIEEVPVPRPQAGPDPRQDRRERRLPHRPACRRRRLAGQAQAALHPGPRGCGSCRAVGAGVAHVKEGDRVGVPWLYTACGHCRHCLGGWETLCRSS